ncbi:MAG: bifunctional 5,10-methylenetetrahydrofolate dehydrogenase/5,10-methenyltetrahydrofolate cyclohydrolase [Clostridiaceae bacterium]
MEAKELKGAPVAEAIRADLRLEIERLKQAGYMPKLSVLLAGNDPGSAWYAQSKAKVGDKLGINVEVTRFAGDVREEELIRHIAGLNEDGLVHGILVELPLPKHINKTKVMNAISPLKDVDGVTAVNRGYVMGGQEDLALVPATPMSCIELIERSGVNLKGKKVTLVGRGDTVGRPLASLLINRDATVTVCHTKTLNLAEECRKAEIIVAAAGRKHLITSDMISQGTIVIDAGINELEDGTFTGDVDYEAVKEKASAITPVPGGVGSLTTTVIMANTIKALKLQKGLK